MSLLWERQFSPRDRNISCDMPPLTVHVIPLHPDELASIRHPSNRAAVEQLISAVAAAARVPEATVGPAPDPGLVALVARVGCR
jgi:hypothetical protein